MTVPVLAFGAMFGLLLMDGSEDPCNPGVLPGTALGVSGETLPTVDGYSAEQLANAAQILEAGKALGLGARDQTIGVMTALGESGLVVVDHGDLAGPDSRGLFQQRDNGAWGSYADRMDPFTSATNFFTAMSRVDGRQSLEPTIVAHRTQANADPFHYARFWDPAIAIVEALSGSDTGLVAGTGDQVCSGGATVPGTVSPTGWAQPGDGPITSRFGMRLHPIRHEWRLHNGTDFAAGGCGGPIWAAQDGVVTFTGADQSGNGTITVDHGGGVLTSYLHMYPSGILVRAGDHVTAGQQIARTGSSGQSTDCHLHFKVEINGTPTDPEPFMAEVGISLT
ncbi:M23 family metallopeptidase [Paraoerskovia sediminicola]|uniref:M23 family metallopeptidase n=1 Tax=Paraoerskovia sediminicola TaxID=1138587 RepID=UPI0025728075|nr:M23 family metallopeptidase [Paraoerskovia sediminicola]